MNTRVKQHDITDCGAACLASVAAHYKLRLPLSLIRQYAGTGRRGTNVLGMIAAAEKLGFTARGVRAPFESLFRIPCPAIAHVILKNSLHHYYVIRTATKKNIVVMDPADGKIHRLPHDVFRDQWTGVLILLFPGSDFSPGRKTAGAAQRCWLLIRPHKNVMLQALAGSIVYTLTGLSVSIYVQKIVDHVLTSSDTGLLNLMSVIMILLLLLQVFTGAMKTLFTLKTGQQIDARLIMGYYRHLLRLPQQFFDTMRVGEIISRINDAVRIRVFINDVSLSLMADVFIVLFSFGLMFLYYWKLALLLLLIIPLYLLVYMIINKLNKSVQRKMMESSAALEAQFVESLNAINTIRCLGLEDHEGAKTEARFTGLLKTVYRSGINTLCAANTTHFITQAFIILLLWTGSGYVIGNELTPGELLSFYALAGYFAGPAANLIGMNRALQDALIAADRLFEVIDLEREESSGKIELTREMTGDIRFRGVSFRYGSRETVFDGLDLCIPKGKTIAVVGESGSGKSTLAALLQNTYTPDGGEIRIGDHDTRHISHSSLRSMVGVVPQQISLFTGSIIENIAPGDYDPDHKKIFTICSRLGMMDFIERIPLGFHAPVGENGVSLSGGQKQRLAIARALYREPEILVMDEATASLDAIAEQYVMDTLDRLRDEGKTVIIIAHRLSTVRRADKIVILSGGKTAGEGAHEEMLNGNALYSRMWERQNGII